MKRIHFVEISVFAKEIAGIETLLIPEFLKDKIKELVEEVPEANKFEIKEIEPSEEFKEVLYEAKIRLEKSGELFMKKIKDLLNGKQIEEIRNTIDDNMYAFIRIDKNKFFSKNEIKPVNHGDCIHIKAKIAAYPAKKEIAQKVFDEI